MASGDGPPDVQQPSVELPEDFLPQVEAQLVAVAGGTDKAMQQGAYRLWMLAVSKVRAHLTHSHTFPGPLAPLTVFVPTGSS